MQKLSKCSVCKNDIPEFHAWTHDGGATVLCKPCYDDPSPRLPQDLNKPAHYHKHDMDTIEFLKRGFPPHVLTGFLIGNIIKYTQRYEYKNGEEDLMKVVDYAKRLEEWHKETHSK